MIRTVGVTQVKYCYRMNINSVQIQFIQDAFHSNQLQAENSLKMTCKSHESRLARARILLSRLKASTLPNLVFSDEKKFDVQHHVNPQNDRVWLRDGEVGPRRVTWAQGVSSVMVWAAVIEPGRSPLVFVEQGVKLNQENYRNDILVGSLLPKVSVSQTMDRVGQCWYWVRRLRQLLFFRGYYEVGKVGNIDIDSR